MPTMNDAIGLLSEAQGQLRHLESSKKEMGIELLAYRRILSALEGTRPASQGGFAESHEWSLVGRIDKFKECVEKDKKAEAEIREQARNVPQPPNVRQ